MDAAKTKELANHLRSAAGRLRDQVASGKAKARWMLVDDVADILAGIADCLQPPTNECEVPDEADGG